MKKVKSFELFKDKRGKFRWRVTSPNGRILAQSSESYTRRKDCVEGAIKTWEILGQMVWDKTDLFPK